MSRLIWFAAVAGVLGLVPAVRANTLHHDTGNGIHSWSVPTNSNSSVSSSSRLASGTATGSRSTAGSSAAVAANIVLATQRLSSILGSNRGENRDPHSGVIATSGHGFVPVQIIPNLRQHGTGSTTGGHGHTTGGHGNIGGSIHPSSVPDGGTTVSLLGVALIGTAVAKRKLDSKAKGS